MTTSLHPLTSFLLAALALAPAVSRAESDAPAPAVAAPAKAEADRIRPVRTETITPVRIASFEEAAKAGRERKLGGSPRTTAEALIFDGAGDGDRQVDPQIAVGNGYVFHATNSGVIIYDTTGRYLRGTTHKALGMGIDPKVFFDPHNRVFAFDVWHYFDKEKTKPVRVCVSETDNPLGAWNMYPVSVLKGVDGGAIGYSRKWIGYSFPGGPEQTFVLAMNAAKSGQPAVVHHFAGSLGHPVNTLDPIDDIHFLQLTERDYVITRVSAGADGAPVVASVVKRPHGLAAFDYPPAAPQPGTDKRVSSGDRNPKNVVFSGGHLWFAQCVNRNGRAAVQWHQITPEGVTVQSGCIEHATRSYIQPTLAVNKRGDVLIGFQEAGPDLFVSPRCAIHAAGSPAGSIGKIIALGEGLGASAGGPWGDYSGSVVDGDNLTDLWTVQSLASAKGKGHTVIAKPVLPAPVTPGAAK